MTKKLIWIYKHEGDSFAATVNDKALLDVAVAYLTNRFRFCLLNGDNVMRQPM